MYSRPSDGAARMSPDERDELFAAALAGSLEPGGAERLAREFEGDPAAIEEFARLAAIDRLLPHACRDPQGEAFAREVELRLEIEARSAASPAVRASFLDAVSLRLRWQWWRLRGAWAAVLVLLAGVAALLFHRAGAPAGPAARLVRAEAAVWADPEGAIASGAALRPGSRIRLTAGFVEVAFSSDVRLVLEGPGQIKILGSKHARLDEGRAVARIHSPRGHGFILDSPRGRLIDRGTEFGVAVAADGNVEVHVLEGRVDVARLGVRAEVRLGENEAVRVTADQAVPVALNASEFLTSLPPQRSGALRFIHWPFDELEGLLCHDHGRELGAGNAAVALTALNRGNGSMPQRVPGRIGGALRFDGESAYAETAFRGIAGRNPRTVAFWVRVPVDSQPEHGFGILAWGNVRKPGAAWQISINPWAEEGALGRLRVGTSQGTVVGSTDLRDGLWHHCAVVMYGGERPSTATHLLLYVDGKLEPSLAKQVRDIDTEIHPGDALLSHGVWLGRNLAFYDPTSSTTVGGRFFRGDLDEVFIFDAALSSDEIATLWKTNRPER
jgi:hypothetical protein